jgi:hypothetical protein
MEEGKVYNFAIKNHDYGMTPILAESIKDEETFDIKQIVPIDTSELKDPPPKIEVPSPIKVNTDHKSIVSDEQNNISESCYDTET